MKFQFFIAILLISFNSYAQSSNVVVSPTPGEINEYLSNKNLINQVTTDCLQNVWDTHLEFFSKYKVSKYYGDRNPQLATRSQRLAIINKVGAPVSIVDELEPISCIGLTRRCLRAGFYETKSTVLMSLWDRIEAKVIENGVSGVVLIQNLQTLGWKVLYWNPSPSENKKWDAEDVKNLTNVKVVKWDSGVKNSKGEFIFHSGWGMHEMRYQDVMKRNMYYTVKVDDKATLVNIGGQIPQKFKQASLFVGTAHAGYHVFPGMRGEVIEAHSMRSLDSINNLEKAAFNPYKGGAPMWTNTEKYRSGVVALPPGEI